MPTRTVNKDFSGMMGDLSQLLHEGIKSPNVRRLAEDAIVSYPHLDNIAAIHAFVSETFPFINDPYEKELFISPNRMAEDYYNGVIRGGDCDCKSLWSGAMLGSVGFKVRLAIADTNFDGEYDHAYTQVMSEILNDWVNVDTTSKFPPGWEYQTGKVIYVQ